MRAPRCRTTGSWTCGSVCIEVHREPVAAPAARFGWKYARTRTLKDDVTVSPLAAPRTTIAIARLFS